MERGTGIEPATSSLGSWHSTAELPPPADPAEIKIAWAFALPQQAWCTSSHAAPLQDDTLGVSGPQGDAERLVRHDAHFLTENNHLARSFATNCNCKGLFAQLRGSLPFAIAGEDQTPQNE
jgi:hypothetical protein